LTYFLEILIILKSILTYVKLEYCNIAIKFRIDLFLSLSISSLLEKSASWFEWFSSFLRI